VCGKAARTVLCGGRAMKRTSLPLRRRTFIAGLGGAALWPAAVHAQQGTIPIVGILSSASLDRNDISDVGAQPAGV
jgi:hypothetical protein